MNAYWVNFVKSGNPNGAGLPAWPRYDPANDALLEFTAEGKAIAKPDPWRKRMDLAQGVSDRAEHTRGK